MNIITTTADLAAACTRLAEADYVTIDTEFIRETTFWPELCLIQMASDDLAVLVDPLADGLDPARELVPAAVARLRSGAWLVMEIGAGQDAAVTEVVTCQPELTLVEIRKDLRGIPRAAVIRRGDA